MPTQVLQAAEIITHYGTRNPYDGITLYGMSLLQSINEHKLVTRNHCKEKTPMLCLIG
jgi:hypothetical protein